jgi:hypothetical protein
MSRIDSCPENITAWVSSDHNRKGAAYESLIILGPYVTPITPFKYGLIRLFRVEASHKALKVGRKGGRLGPKEKSLTSAQHRWQLEAVSIRHMGCLPSAAP